MKTVAFVSLMEGYPWGGSEELWSQAAMELLRRGIPVRANFRHWDAPSERFGPLIEAGCVMTFRRPPRTMMERAVHKVRPYLPFNWLNMLDDPLVVISQGANAEGGAWAAACIERKLPYVLISHSAGIPWWPDDARVYAMRRAHEHALASFFVSQQNLEMTRRQLVVEGRQFEVVWNPFNLRYDASPPWPTEDEPLRLACVARIEAKIKGQDLLIDVMNQAKWRARAVVVDCFGGGPNERVLPEYVQKIGLPSVRFCGFEGDVEKIWASHHALVLTSRVEGLPLVVVEATLCGRPCVVTDVGGNREIVEDEVTGFVARSASMESVDDAMERMWRRRGELRAMGAKGAQRLRTRLPRDPGKVFAERLMSIMPNGQRSDNQRAERS